MSQSPDQLRAEIDRTRSNLSTDVDALTDRVAPTHIAHRQAEKVRGAATSVKERVMGRADDVRASAAGAAHDASGGLGGAAHHASDAAQQAPAALRGQTRGNPLAAGLIALGAGWLVGSLIPASSREQQLAGTVKEGAGALGQPVADAAKEVADHLREPAQEAAQSLRSTAQDAAGTVQQEGADAGRHLQGEAQDAQSAVRDSR